MRLFFVHPYPVFYIYFVISVNTIKVIFTDIKKDQYA